MLPKKSRMDRLHFIQTKTRGRRSDSPYFSMVLTPPEGASLSSGKCSVVVSTKVSKKAVTRNHIKRLIYDQLSTKILKSNLIIFPKPKTAILSDEEIIFNLNSDLSKVSFS